MADPWKKAKIDQINMLLNGALDAESLVGLKMNVPGDKVDAVMDELPSANSPTIAHLYNSDWLSVEIVVAQSIVRDLIPKLHAKGAQAIIEFTLNKVI